MSRGEEAFNDVCTDPEGTVKRAILYLLTVLFLLTVFSCAGLSGDAAPTAAAEGAIEIPHPSPEITLLAVGDINLGRKAGRIILGGNVDYAFEKTRADLAIEMINGIYNLCRDVLKRGV